MRSSSTISDRRLADACIFIIKHYSDVGFLNVGTGQNVTIAEFARVITEVAGYKGELVYDTSKPDGMPRKLLEISRLAALGWRAKMPLREGLAVACADYLAGGGRARG